eukprot:3695173-Rhodomonas_salina.1
MPPNVSTPHPPAKSLPHVLASHYVLPKSLPHVLASHYVLPKSLPHVTRPTSPDMGERERGGDAEASDGLFGARDGVTPCPQHPVH